MVDEDGPIGTLCILVSATVLSVYAHMLMCTHGVVPRRTSDSGSHSANT